MAETVVITSLIVLLPQNHVTTLGQWVVNRSLGVTFKMKHSGAGMQPHGCLSPSCSGEGDQEC